MQETTLDLLKRLAKALSTQFGDNCEIVVHDISSGDPENTIAVIENGHVSRRNADAGPSHIALEAMKEGRRNIPDQYNYLTQTADGRILRSSTVYVNDDAGRPIGIFCINYDLTALMMAKATVDALVQDPRASGEPERIPTNVNDLLDELLEQSVRIVGKPVAMMNKASATSTTRAQCSSPKAGTKSRNILGSANTRCTHIWIPVREIRNPDSGSFQTSLAERTAKHHEFQLR